MTTKLLYRFIPLRTPEARFKFHVVMALVWLFSMGVVPFFKWDSFGVLAIIEVSLYANFSTELGALDSSKASDQTEGFDNDLPGDTGQLRLPL